MEKRNIALSEPPMPGPDASLEEIRAWKGKMREYDRKRIELGIASAEEVQEENSFIPREFLRSINLQAIKANF